MNEYNILEQRAKKLLDICMKYQNDLFYFLIEGPGFDLYTKNNLGEKEFAVNLRVQAIYDKYKESPEVKELFERTLQDVAENNKSGEYVNYLLLLVEYQLKKEKQNEAPFKIDIGLILENLRKNIIENYDKYNKSTTSSPNNFISNVQKHDTILEENYGYKIL